jgi:hypothetical protein
MVERADLSRRYSLSATQSKEDLCCAPQCNLSEIQSGLE